MGVGQQATTDDELAILAELDGTTAPQEQAAAPQAGRAPAERTPGAERKEAGRREPEAS